MGGVRAPRLNLLRFPPPLVPRPKGAPERRSRGSRFKRQLSRIPHPHLPHLTLARVRVLRLFTLLFVFSVLVLYAVFRSARFQELLRQKAERMASDAIGRQVSIGGFDLALVPFSLGVKGIS